MRRPTNLRPLYPEPPCRFWQDIALYTVCCIAIASMVVW